MRRNPIFTTVTFTVSFLLGFACMGSVAYAAISGSSAADYAHKWSANGETTRNPAYRSFSGDCTNFVSQALRAGGWDNDNSGDWRWWYDSSGIDEWSRSWTVTLDLARYALNSGRANGAYYPAMTGRYSGAGKGDLYLYEWGDSDGWDHMSMATGSGNFANYGSYRRVTGGYGSYMTQHSNDRDYAPWNWGYWTESDVSTRKKMKTVRIDIK